MLKSKRNVKENICMDALYLIFSLQLVIHTKCSKHLGRIKGGAFGLYS
jgi:hypothetical protein